MFEFRQEFINKWPLDPLFEEYMKVWDRYFVIVDFDRKLANKIISGYKLKKEFDKDKWQLAKMNSLKFSERKGFKKQYV